MERVESRTRSFVNTCLFWALTLAGIGLLFIVVALPIIKKRCTMELVSERMASRNTELLDEKDRLEKEEIALAGGDPFFVEKLAREDLNMVRPGEHEFEVTPVGAPARRHDAHRPTAEPTAMLNICGTLEPIAENHLLRQVALVLGGLSLIAAVILFSRASASRTTA